MDKKAYLEMRQKLAAATEQPRGLCVRCFQSVQTCYCTEVRPFDPKIKFAILIHPHEARRRIATGRMSHLCLQNSYLIEGDDFTHNKQVNSILENPGMHSMILYPGKESVNLSSLTEDARSVLFPGEKELVVFVIDGTWRMAKKMLRLSANLCSIPQVCFSPPRLSKFRVRKQPAPECFSTIEAIHHTIELFGSDRGFDIAAREHDHLLEMFDSMVERQLEFTPQNRERHLRKNG